jgi:hypothetical protein
MTQNGQAFELVMPERPINDSEFSSLPTLKARDHQAEGYEAGLRRTTPQLGTIVKGIVDEDERVMLPTPRANEPGSTSVGYGDSLNDFASRVVNGYARKDIELLRSPTASQGQGGALGEAEARKRGNTVGIRDQAMDLAKLQGHKVTRESDNLLPTPTTQDTSGTCRDHGGDLLHEIICGCPRAERKPDLFPTPVASEGVKATAAQGSEEKSLTGQVWLTNIAHDLATENGLPTPPRQLLGTPRANAANSSSKEVEAGAPKSRIEDQVKLLPTVRGQNGESRNNNIWERDPKKPQNLENALYHAIVNWGKFEPAIRRWEAIIDRPAPEPTKPDGKEGNHRLSSKFTEWMMGLPDGWITGHDLKRNDELKLAGNGVVPQQAELALSLLGIKEILER